MCSPLLRDPLNRLWQTQVLDQGNLTATLTNINSPYPKNPTLQVGSSFWQLEITSKGSLTSTKVGKPNLTALPYIPMTSLGGVNYKLTVLDPSGIIGVTTTGSVLPDFIPYSPDVSMSFWPTANTGVFCTTCGNASVTVSADLSCWCCSCSTWVLPEDTNILVQLEE